MGIFVLSNYGKYLSNSENSHFDSYEALITRQKDSL